MKIKIIFFGNILENVDFIFIFADEQIKLLLLLFLPKWKNFETARVSRELMCLQNNFLLCWKFRRKGKIERRIKLFALENTDSFSRRVFA